MAAEAGQPAAAVILREPVDVGRAKARRAAAEELGEPRYEHESLTERAWRWLQEFLGSLVDQVAREGLGGVASVTLLVAVLVVLAALLLWSTRRMSGGMRPGTAELFDEARLGAAEHRARAQRLAREARWSEAIQERLRAIAGSLEDREILAALPGRTANELAVAAGRALPAQAAGLTYAARLFDAVTYGEDPGSAEGYAAVAGLDDDLDRAKPLVATR
ncbi:MAG: DUF4129 domain-containing protein [Nocardioidaceae bacterium]